MQVTLDSRSRNPHGPAGACKKPPRPVRALLQISVIPFCLLLLVHAFFLETFYVPTGSMAPALRGEHRQCVCPTCGNHVLVGKHPAEKAQPRESLYQKAFCPWCGAGGLPVVQAPLRNGDRLLVNKLAYLCRGPRRWEIVVFRLWGGFFIKRILGLPGEELLISDGEVYVDAELLRKTWDEMIELRVPLFDQELPGPGGWHARWEREGAPATLASSLAVADLELDALSTPRCLTYRNFSYGERKCVPLRDEQPYNGGLHADWEHVHDFSMETEMEIVAGRGVFSVSLFDGQDEIELSVPVAQDSEGLQTVRIGMPTEKALAVLRIARRGRTSTEEEVLAECAGFSVSAKRCKLELSFVDRRVMLRIDGRQPFVPIDLPSPKHREAVIRPLRLRADHAHVRLHGLRLFRDVHYTQSGENAVKGRPVRLGAGQYFVLGDNSGRSEDSRSWPEQGVVPAEAIVGRPVWHD